MSRLNELNPAPKREQLLERTPALHKRVLSEITTKVSYTLGSGAREFLSDLGLTDSQIKISVDTDESFEAILGEPHRIEKLLLDETLSELSESANSDDHALLFQIIEQCCHPLRHGGYEWKAEETAGMFNTVLEYDGLMLVFSDGNSAPAMQLTKDGPKPSKARPSDRLYFTHRTGKVTYKGKSFDTSSKRTKEYALLTYMSESRDFDVDADEIIEHTSTTEELDMKAPFKDAKDVYNTLSRIKRKLGAKNNEYFPIEYTKNIFTWRKD